MQGEMHRKMQTKLKAKTPTELEPGGGFCSGCASVAGKHGFDVWRVDSRIKPSIELL